MEPAIPEQSASQLNQREVVDVLLLVPHQDPAALRQPCERPLDHPSPRLVALRSVAALLFLADPADVRGVSGCGRRPSPVGLSYALSRGMCCGSSFVGSGRSTTILSIVAARSLRSRTFAPAITTPSGPPSPSVTMLFLVPFFPRSVGFLPVFFPPKRALPSIASAAATPTAPRRVRHTRRPRPPRLARRSLLQPSAGTSRGRCSWVRTARAVGPTGTAAQPEDDRVQHFPPIGDLPPSRVLGPEFQEDRSIRAQLVEISQIVPSGLRRGFRRTIAQSAVVMPGSGHCLLQAPSCKRCSAGSSDGLLSRRFTHELRTVHCG